MANASSNSLSRFPPEGTDPTIYYQMIPHDAATLRVLNDYGTIFVHTRTGSLYYFDETWQGFYNFNRQRYEGYWEPERGNRRDYPTPCVPSCGFAYELPNQVADFPSDVRMLGCYYVDANLHVASTSTGPMTMMQTGGAPSGYFPNRQQQQPYQFGEGAASFGGYEPSATPYQFMPVPEPGPFFYPPIRQAPPQFHSMFRQPRPPFFGQQYGAPPMSTLETGTHPKYAASSMTTRPISVATTATSSSVSTSSEFGTSAIPISSPLTRELLSNRVDLFINERVGMALHGALFDDLQRRRTNEQKREDNLLTGSAAASAERVHQAARLANTTIVPEPGEVDRARFKMTVVLDNHIREFTWALLVSLQQKLYVRHLTLGSCAILPRDFFHPESVDTSGISSPASGSTTRANEPMMT